MLRGIEYHSQAWNNGSSPSFVHFWHTDQETWQQSVHYGTVECFVSVTAAQNPDIQFMTACICTHRAVPQQRQPLLNLAELTPTPRRSYILASAIIGPAAFVTNAHLRQLTDPPKQVMAVVFI